MHFVIYFFSGTGNTEWVARKLARRLHTFGHTCMTLSCESLCDEYLEPELSDIVGLLFPVHGCRPPKAFRDLIRRLPPVANQPLFAITTSGHMPGDTAWKTVVPLKAIGYDPVVTDNVIMPNNFYCPPLANVPVTIPRKAPKILERASRRIDEIAIRIQKAQRRLAGSGPLSRILGIKQRSLYRIMRSRLDQGMHVDGSCNQCSWCVDHCPVANIQLSRDRVKFLNQCIHCMRCYSFCPENAIHLIQLCRKDKLQSRYNGPEQKPYPDQ